MTRIAGVGGLTFFLFLAHLLLRSTSLMSHDGSVLLLLKNVEWRYARNALGDWNESHPNPCNWTGISCDAFSTVTSVDLKGFSISGNLTSTICRLSNLRALNLQRNAFTGPFPIGLLHCKRLRKLDLASNQFAGALPSRISELSELSVLNLAHNTFTAAVPPAFAMLTKLESLFFHQNCLNGPFPSYILGNLQSLQHLTLGKNPLRPSAIPTELADLKQLRQLRLDNCGLVGGIPSFLGSLTRLELLDMSRNQLSGEIPPELGRLNLNLLNVSHNHLSGRIPDALDFPAYKEGFLGNPKLCGGHNLMLPPCSPRKLLDNRLLVILLPPVIVAALTLSCICRFRPKQQGDDLRNTLENLFKVAAIFVPTAFAFLVSASPTASTIHNQHQTNDKKIAFRIFLIGDIAAIISSLIVALKLGMRHPGTNGLALFGKLGLCITVVFFIFSFFALLYLMMMSKKYRF